MSEEEAECRRRLAADPSSVEAHVALSKLLLRARRPEEAVAHLWPAIQAAPREASAPLRFQLGLATALQGQHDAAEPLFEQVLTLEPTFVECLLWCARALLWGGMRVEPALTRTPRVESRSLASTQEALGKREEARQTLERAAELRPYATAIRIVATNNPLPLR